MTESPRSYSPDPGETPSDVPDVGILPLTGLDLHRLQEVLGEAAEAHRLSWHEVDVVLTIIERHEYIASETYWTVYLGLAPKRQPARRGEEAA